MGARGSALTEVQKLLDGERRRGEARVALNLLGHRLLQQPPEQPHPRRGSAHTSRDAQAAAGAGAAERRRSGTFAERAVRPRPRPRRPGGAAAAATAAAAAAAAAPPRPLLAARGFPRPRLRGWSRLPHVRGARGELGAGGARGRSRRPLIGRRRLRVLQPLGAWSFLRGSWSRPGGLVPRRRVPPPTGSSAAERRRRCGGWEEAGAHVSNLILPPLRPLAEVPLPGAPGLAAAREGAAYTLILRLSGAGRH